jgi:murein DD-endopeptidase MepM/ murein hydrolase activator NlpD
MVWQLTGRIALLVVLLACTGAVAQPAGLPPPVSPTCVTSPYGPRVLPGLPKAGTFHPGIDLRAPAGAAVRAVAPGQVLAIRRRGVGGLFVKVRHDGFDALYAHLGSIAPPLAEGKRTLAAGEKIGVVGRTGVSYGAHLYFQVEINGAHVDPAPLLGVAPCG